MEARKAELIELDEERRKARQRRVPPAQGTRSLGFDFGGPIELSISQGTLAAAPTPLTGWRKMPPVGQAQDGGAPGYRASHFERAADDDQDQEGASQPQLQVVPPQQSTTSTTITTTNSSAGGAVMAPAPPPSEEEEQQQAVMVEDDQLRKDLETLNGGPPAAAPSAAPGSGGPRAAAQEAQPEHPHAVFDRMKMGMATVFNVGTFDLERRLDQFDAVIERDRRGRESQVQAAASLQQPPERELSPAEVHAEALEDLSFIRDASAGHNEQLRDVVLTVPLVPAQEKLSSWSAAAAMLLAWRDGLPAVDPAEVAAGSGKWAPFTHSLDAIGPEFFEAWGLQTSPHRSFPMERLHGLLAAHGPLWISSDPPGRHAVVVTGLSDVHSPEMAKVHVSDPWDRDRAELKLPNNGSTYLVRFQQFAAKRLFVAHLRRAP